MIFGVWLECTLQWEWQQSGFGVYTPSWSVHSVRVRVVLYVYWFVLPVPLPFDTTIGAERQAELCFCAVQF